MTTIIHPERHYPSEIGANSVYWLVDIHYGTEIVRLSTEHLDVADAIEGTTHAYWGRLPALRFTDALGAIGEVTEGATTSLDAVMPVDVAEMEARGHRLEGSTVELARWVWGTDYSERRIVFRGQVTDPRIGADGEPVSFSVKNVPWEDERLVPTENQRVISRTTATSAFGSLDDAEIGKYYPIIFGKPGKVAPGVQAREWITASRARRYNRQGTVVLSGGNIVGFNEMSAVLAGHHVQATRVWASTNAYPAGERFGVYNTSDERGQPIAVLFATPDGSVPTTGPSTNWEVTDPDGNTTYGLGRGVATGATPADAQGSIIDASFQPFAATIDNGRFDLFVGWLNDSQDSGGGEGGMIGADGNLVRGAGDVLHWLMSQSNKPIDHGRFAAAAPLLNGFKIDAVIDTPIKPFDFARDEILPIIPARLVTGPNGIYPVVFRYHATAADAVATLDADVDGRIDRSSRIRVDSSKIINHFALDYAYSARTSRYWTTTELGAGPYDSDAPEIQTSIYCRLSQQRYRYSNGKPRVITKKIQSRVIYETATAHAVLAWLARAHCLATREISYVVPEKEWGWLERGMVLLLNDSEVHISGWLVHVLDVQILDNDMIGLELMYLEDPPRDARSYG